MDIVAYPPHTGNEAPHLSLVSFIPAQSFVNNHSSQSLHLSVLSISKKDHEWYKDDSKVFLTFKYSSKIIFIVHVKFHYVDLPVFI